MENTMNPDFIRNVLLQSIYDEDDTFDPGTSECNKLKIDLTSLTLTCKCCTSEGLFRYKEQTYVLEGVKSFWKDVEIC